MLVYIYFMVGQSSMKISFLVPIWVIIKLSIHRPKFRLRGRTHTKAMGQRDCCDYDDDCCNCNCSWTEISIWGVGGIVFTVVLILAFAVIKPPKSTADDALLMRFSLYPSTNASTPQPQLLSYNTTIAISLRNPNMYYDMS
jgi:hypothetical protein